MNKLFVLIDCPLATSDKKWITDKLHVEGYETVCKDVPEKLSQLLIKGEKWREHVLQMKQIWSVLRESKKNDVIVIWYSITGVLFNLFSYLFGGRNIIIMNWMINDIPASSKSLRTALVSWPFKKAIKNSRCRILINQKDVVSDYNNKYSTGETNPNKFFFFPDVYDETESFIEPQNEKPEQDRYFFTGGMANRDWKLLSEIAKKRPNYKFVCVALKDDFESKVTDVPDNMEVYFNLKADDYYSLMTGAYTMLLPLQNPKSVGGLINVLKSWQKGLPCYVTRTKFLEPYYPESENRFLLDGGVDNWLERIDEMMTFSPNEYKEKVEVMQQYIKYNFSPDGAIIKLREIVKLINASNI